MPLLDRDAELTTLLGLIDRLAQGTGGAGFVEAEPGLGKTALLTAVAAEAAARGHDVFRGAAGELDADRPLGPVAEALGIHRAGADPQRAEIGRLLDETAHTLLRHRLIDAVVSLVERLSLTNPTVLILEDLHWADETTLLAVHHLRSRLSHLPVVLLASLRPMPRSALLRRIVDGGMHLMLGPLGDDAVAALVQAVAQAPPSARLLTAARAAGGNPLYLTELVRTLRAEGRLDLAGGVADTDDRAAPRSLRWLVLQQLAALSAGTVPVLRVAAVLGASFSVTDLGTVLDRAPSELMRDLGEALDARIVDDAGDCLVFRHQVVRDAVYLDLPEAVRRGLHLQAGRALAAAGADPVTVAPHLVRGATPGDESAVDWLCRAASQVAPTTPAAAVDLFEQALRLIEKNDPRRYAITADLVEVLIWARRYPDLLALAHEIADHDPDDQRRNSVRLSVTRALLMVGKCPEARAEVEAGMRDFRGSERDRLRLRAGPDALTLAFAGASADAQALLDDVLRQAERLGDDEARQSGHTVLCIASLLLGETGRAVAAGETALALGGASTSVAHRWGAHIFHGTALMDADRLDDGHRVLRHGRRVADWAGMPWQAMHYHAQIGLFHFDVGRWDDAIAELEAASLVAGDFAGMPSTFAEAIAAVVEVRRGSLSAAAAHVERARRAIAHGHVLGADAALRAEALVHEAKGDRDTALILIEQAWRLNLAAGMPGQNVRIGPDLVRLALAAGHGELAALAAAEAGRLAELNPVASRRGLALLCRGLVESDPETLAEAVRVCRETPRLGDQATAGLAAGAAFAAAGRRIEAVDLLVDAITAAERCGAARDVAEGEAALRGLKVRRGPRRPHRPTATGWDALTSTELAIVRLAVEGLTNAQIGQRLFTSPRTVETHFSHVFAKLGLSSRVQVAAEAARRQNSASSVREDPTRPVPAIPATHSSSEHRPW
ncbi:AAA family ATPase [Actinoplanes sp. NEAU-A12]|uniref:AAA family ATPase n=1 Tax=Actinoplanes sandaracinus TaxID=3045177 RepID=A0ABT6WWI1_9ACTN|nr:AAA family ATPase [Actinoplanes sandaracinus]MDI6104107.1 AAA family ATPase [Actinoplanes sandaracinus]